MAPHARRIAAGDVEGLAQLVALSRQLEETTATAVTGLRQRACSWTEIATRLGITRQAAQQRWGANSGGVILREFSQVVRTPDRLGHGRTTSRTQPRRKTAMKKIITTALVAATAVAALSACSSVANSSNAAGKTHQAATTGNKTKAQATTAKKTKAPAAPKYTVAQQNAIESAHSYLDLSGFSRTGLIQQLSSKAGEGFKVADAVFAVNHIKVDWNKEAVESAKSYLQMGGFSRASLIQQLSSKAGEQFTLAQATYAANHVGL